MVSTEKGCAKEGPMKQEQEIISKHSRWMECTLIENKVQEQLTYRPCQQDQKQKSSLILGTEKTPQNRLLRLAIPSSENVFTSAMVPNNCS